MVSAGAMTSPKSTMTRDSPGRRTLSKSLVKDTVLHDVVVAGRGRDGEMVAIGVGQNRHVAHEIGLERPPQPRVLIYVGTGHELSQVARVDVWLRIDRVRLGGHGVD